MHANIFSSINHHFEKPTQAIKKGYFVALCLLALIAFGNFLVIAEMIRAQTKAVELTEIAVNQRAELRRVAQIVELILRTLEHKSDNLRLAKLTQQELLVLISQIENNQIKIDLAFKRPESPLASLLRIPQLLPPNADELSVHTKQLVYKLRQLSSLDSSIVEWRFSVWAPIELALASNGVIMTQVDTITKNLYLQSFETSKRFSRIHNILVLITLVTLVAEALFIFQPLIKRLTFAHRRFLTINDELRYLATHDSLTGIGNRLLFNNTLKSLGETSEPFPVILMFIDLDDFKNINDIYGHTAGDHALRMIAQRIQLVLKGNGDLFRVGGDEFAILVQKNCTKDMAHNLAQQLLEEINKLIIFDDDELYIKTSVGIAGPLTINLASIENPLKQAGFALRAAKKSGKGAVRFYEEGTMPSSETIDKQAKRIAEAIKNGEMQPYYQPIIDLASNRILGFEVLARWHSLDQGVVSPREFIPIIEDYGMLDMLTEHMLACVAVDRANCLRANVELGFVSVNFPECVLVDKRLPERIIKILGTDRLNWLHIEILETALLHRASTIIQANLLKLIELGAHIALDDFGTGHASLSHLRNFPCQTIKIDRSFIENIVIDKNSQLITKGVIEIVHGLGMTIIVEGIETAEQRDFFLSWPSIAGQGFYFYKPQPIWSLLGLLVDHQKQMQRFSS